MEGERDFIYVRNLYVTSSTVNSNSLLVTRPQTMDSFGRIFFSNSLQTLATVCRHSKVSEDYLEANIPACLDFE